MPRFLFVDPGLESVLEDGSTPVGGATVQALNWMRGLAETGQEVACVTARSVASPHIVGLETFSGYEPTGGWGYVTNQFGFLLNVLRKYRPNYVYQGAAGIITGLLGMLVPSVGGRFLHRLANDADVDERVKHRMGRTKRFIYRFGLKQASAILCQTDYQYDRMRKLAPRKPVLRIVNPIMIGATERLLRQSHRSYAAWIGIFKSQKNLAALYELAASLPSMLFAVAGSGPPAGMHSEIQRTIEGLGSLPNVRMVGYLRRDCVPDFLARAHALLGTSHYEGFPNTYLEAWSVGTPVLALRSADPDGLIARKGLGAARDNIRDLGAALCELTDPNLFRQVAVRCVEHVETEHQAPLVAQRLTEWLSATFDNVR